MARKSRLDVIKERYPGKWKYVPENRWVWTCSDGRQVVRQRNCTCWVFNSGKCNCPVVYMMQDAGKNYVIDIDDDAIYYLNGKNTVKRNA